MSKQYPTPTDDVIDSRDVIEAIDELRALEDGEGLTEDDAEVLAALCVFAAEACEVSDWQYGETFVRDDYFEDYARELAEDCDMVPADAGWPLRCIDWEQAARELRMDYTSYTFDGVTYWARA